MGIANLNVDKKETFIKNYTISLNKFNILDKKKFNEELCKYNYPDMYIYNNYVIHTLSEEKEIAPPSLESDIFDELR